MNSFAGTRIILTTSSTKKTRRWGAAPFFPKTFFKSLAEVSAYLTRQE